MGLMKGLFIPDITAEMFRNGCLESIEALMAEGEVYDIEYDPKSEEQNVPDRNVGDMISRQAAIDALKMDISIIPFIKAREYVRAAIETIYNRFEELPSAQPEIIRCKDCKYAEVADKEDSQDGYTCQFHRGSIWFSGSYCSWAERKEEHTMEEFIYGQDMGNPEDGSL